MESYLAQRVGEVNANPCTHCNKGSGPFEVCVSVTEQLNQSCANCHYNNESSRCSLRKFTARFRAFPGFDSNITAVQEASLHLRTLPLQSMLLQPLIHLLLSSFRPQIHRFRPQLHRLPPVIYVVFSLQILVQLVVVSLILLIPVLPGVRMLSKPLLHLLVSFRPI